MYNNIFLRRSDRLNCRSYGRPKEIKHVSGVFTRSIAKAVAHNAKNGNVTLFIYNICCV